jgi:two-component system NtrC family sensor kinase
MKLKTKFTLGTVTVFGLLAVVVAAVTVLQISEGVIELSKNRVRLDINSAWMIYNTRANRILDRARFIAKDLEGMDRGTGESKFAHERLEAFKRKLVLYKDEKGYELDVLTLVQPNRKVILRTNPPYNEGDFATEDILVENAIKTRESVSGTILLGHARLEMEGENQKGENLLKKCIDNGGIPEGLFMGAAVPLVSGGEFWAVLEVGVILNGAKEKVDEIRKVVFEEKDYKGKPVGTATIFMGDRRISTNVRDSRGLTAMGTTAAPEVAARVLGSGSSWTGSARVVDTPYLSQYDPIRDPTGRIIGMLYVGELEEIYRDMRTRAVLVNLAVVGGGMALSWIIFVPLSRSLLFPIRKLAHATEIIAQGFLSHRVRVTSDDEVGQLSRAFDRMAEELEVRGREIHARQQAIEAANEDLRNLNKSYMDLLGFVSHELKNPLSSAVMGLYSVKDGYLGAVTDVQKKALDSVAKSLDYFKEIIKSYLDLSRLEKGEIVVRKVVVPFEPLVLVPVVESHERALLARGMRIETSIPAGFTVNADKDLLRIVLDNLLGNAIKYGRDEGRVSVEAETSGSESRVSVTNEGEGIPQDKLHLLFRKFSRVAESSLAGKKGTGLGLYICKEIVEKHGGRIWVESEQGKWTRFTLSLPRET